MTENSWKQWLSDMFKNALLPVIGALIGFLGGWVFQSYLFQARISKLEAKAEKIEGDFRWVREDLLKQVLQPLLDGKLQKLEEKVARFESIVDPSAAIPKNADAKITSHNSASGIDRYPTVVGTFHNVPREVGMWLYLYSSGEYAYYVVEISDRSLNGTWIVDKKMIVGGDTDKGLYYRIGVFFANPELNREIRAQTHAKEAKGDEKWLGGLPRGVLVKDEISLRRR